MSFSSLSDLVKHFESSGGNYTAVNPQSGAGGAYQFVPSTWNQYAGQIGVDTSLYPTAQSAPPAVQDAVFNQAVAQRGLGDWTCPGCNPALTSYVASNDVSALPLEGYGSNGVVPYTGADGIPTVNVTPSGTTGQPATTSGGGSGSGGSSAGAGATGLSVGYLPPAQTGGPMTLGLATGVTTAISNWIGGIESSVGTAFENALSGVLGTAGNYLMRFFLICIGIVVLAIGL
jgi:hypothetical protein